MIVGCLVCCFFVQSLTPEVIEHSQAGAKAREHGQWDVAVQEFRKVVELTPNSATGHGDLGDAYFQKGDYTAAIPELETALRLSPNLMATHQTLGVALLVQGNAEAALPHLEKMRSPDLLGLAYLETGRLGSAITALQAALEKKPGDVDLLYDLGRATASASKRSMEQLAKINPDLARRANAADRLARINPALAAGNAGAAAADAGANHDLAGMLNALAGQPNDPDLLFNLSHAAGAASHEAFDKIIEADPNSARAHQVNAERYSEAGRLADAEREYSESLRIRPFTAHLHHAFGDVLAAEGKWDAAIVQLRLETQVQPASADAFFGLGNLLLKRGQASDALDAFSQADRLHPDMPQVLLVLGRAASDANDTARAESAWKKLLSIDPQSGAAAAAHLGLSTLYRRNGRPQEADREMAAYELLKNQNGR